MNEVSTPEYAPPEPPWATQGSSPFGAVVRGWGTGLIRGGLAFVVMALVGQATAFVVNLGSGGDASIGTVAKLGWLYFGWFHHVAFTTSVVGLRPGSGLAGQAGLDADVGVAMMLATFLAIALLYKGGRAVADRAGGGGVARILHGMKVAPAYAILALLVSELVIIDIPFPRIGSVSGGLQVRSWGPSWFLLPLLIAVVSGAAGGLRSGRHELLSHDPWGPRAAGAVVGGLRMFMLGLVLPFVGLLVLAGVHPSATKAYFQTISRPPTDQAVAIIANHALLLPNQSLWVLVPAMGGCDGMTGGGTSASFLCYSKFPGAMTRPEGLRPRTPVVRTNFGRAPLGYFLFLLVPALSAILGGRYAARKRARLQWEAVAVGAASGVVFAVLVVVGSWFASVSVRSPSTVGGIPGNASVLIGPGLVAGGLLALAWGVVGGGLGGWLEGRKLPSRAEIPRSSGSSAWGAGHTVGSPDVRPG
ncbi:MAG TPA: hypothetical protein VE646_08085 [Actinomycetota bacterium]|nr:hypothetical protein [Actinomycetota bacterium]